MKSRYLFAIAAAAATAGAACGAAPTDSLQNGDNLGGDGSGDGDGSGGGRSRTGGKTGGTTTPGTTDTGPGTTSEGPSGPTPTNNPAAKEFYMSTVHPVMVTACGTCHDSAGPGVYWLTRADADKSYGQLFALGYVTPNSRILQKGPHGGVTNNVFTGEQQATWNQWVNMEVASGGTKATPNVLEKVASCIDPAKFAAIGLETIRTIRRTNNNNTNAVTGWNENANQCTGCNNAPCRNCHSADPGSGFALALGNQSLPANFTFEQTKLTNPPYLQKYFGVSATGEPVASNAIALKADATAKDKAYTHPYYQVTPAQQAAIKAFVDDVVAKYAAGACTAPPP